MATSSSSRATLTLSSSPRPTMRGSSLRSVGSLRRTRVPYSECSTSAENGTPPQTDAWTPSTANGQQRRPHLVFTLPTQSGENIRALSDEEFFEDEEESFEEKKKVAREYLNKIYEANLDKSKKYMFLIEPCKEERIVCLTNSPRFFNIGVFDKDNNLSLTEDVVLDGFMVPKPQELFFEDMREMLQALDNIDIKRIQGFIAIQSEQGRDDKHFKILTNRYKYYFGLRGNTSSIRFRFLELEYQNTLIHLGQGTNQQTTAQTQPDVDRLLRYVRLQRRAPAQLHLARGRRGPLPEVPNQIHQEEPC